MSKLTPEERVAYLRAVWETFQKKAGTEREITNSEYWMAVKWLDSGVPLFAVIRGIEEFEGKPRRLEAVRRPVDRAVTYWTKAVGV